MVECGQAEASHGCVHCMRQPCSLASATLDIFRLDKVSSLPGHPIKAQMRISAQSALTPLCTLWSAHRHSVHCAARDFHGSTRKRVSSRHLAHPSKHKGHAMRPKLTGPGGPTCGVLSWLSDMERASASCRSSSGLHVSWQDFRQMSQFY